MALRAKPATVDGQIPYQEIIQHPAFKSDVVNTGVFELTKPGTLVRRQQLPIVENMEIGAYSIDIRRNGKITTRPIPDRLTPYFAMLQAVISGQPIPRHDAYDHTLTRTPTGWSVQVTAKTGRALAIEFLGCGSVLHAIKLAQKKGHERHIRFTGQ